MQPKFAIVCSEFNNDITSKLLAGAKERLLAEGVADDHIEIYKVPGAIEIPLIAQLLAQQEKFASIICLGAVIRGETTHYDYVCQQVSSGCQNVMLAFNVPVIFGVLTTENEVQAQARAGGSEGHKGREAADAALAMVATVAKIKNYCTAIKHA